MPYQIQKYKDGYRVYSISGTPLSHKALPLRQAIKQKIAATLSSVRRTSGGSQGMGNEGYALTDTDIQKILGGTSLFKYPELEGMSSIDDAFDDAGRAIMLYLTENADTGHWVCMLKKGKTVEYFDPYGGYKPDGERRWLTKEKLEELGQDEPLLTKMLREGGYKVVSNPYHFQKKPEEAEGDVNTCGRHCCSRLLLGHLSLPQYHKTIMNSGVPPDEFVTTLTAQVLNK
jgi:hypothetical protein